MKIIAIIPAKGSSIRLKNKNLLSIGGESLVRIACKKALCSKYINEVYIDTESDFVLAQVQDLYREGLKVLKRPASLASNRTGANEMMMYGVHSVSECDVLLQTFSTSPTLTVETIDKSIEKFIENYEKYDSFFTVVKMQEYFWDGKKEVNFNRKELPNSFELETMYMETHGLYGIKTEALIKNKTRIGENPLMIEVSKTESIDIDDYEDFLTAQGVMYVRR